MPFSPPNHTVKTDLRRELRARRNALSDAQRDEFSARIVEHLKIWLLSLDNFKPTIALYQALPREVDLNALLNVNFEFVVPRFVDGKWIDADEVGVFEKYEPLKRHPPSRAPGDGCAINSPPSRTNLTAKLSAKADCCSEGTPACRFNGSFSPSQIDIFLIPSLAFDTAGNRLGQGGGWYDRILSRAPNALKIGVAFACQIIESVPHQAHDVKMDGIVTENGWCKYLQR